MFIEKMQEVILEDYNEKRTENGALGYATTGRKLLDMNFAIASYRQKTEQAIISDFVLAYNENPELALKWLFFSRDIRCGVGERRLFRVVVKYLAKNIPEVIDKFIPYFGFYGRFDDLFVLFDTPCENSMIGYISEVLNYDYMMMQEGKSISLLAKWMPSVDSKVYKGFAKRFCTAYQLPKSHYKNVLKEMRTYLDVVEKKMSSGEWDKINYEAVPSKANLIYKDAFVKHDTVRRTEYLTKVSNGEAKINAGVLFPHEIVNKYGGGNNCWSNTIKSVDVTLEELWKALPNFVEGDNTTLVIADGSGSMCSQIDTKSTTTALDVANALSIYFAERATGEFKDKYITFSGSPKLVDLSNCTTLRDKINQARKHDECANTNIERVFKLILDTAVKNHMSQEDMPKNLLIVSDMEFDIQTSGDTSIHMFKTFEQKYEDEGYKLPRLVFWNVNSRTNVIPIREADNGVALISGFSVNLIKMVMSNKLDPFEVLVDQLMSERYEPIKL